MRLVFLLLPLALGLAQDHSMPPEKPVALLHGMGAWRHPIATSNPEAQKFFDQGMALLYGFNRYEALRSFKKAAELDPAAAMAWWGVAMAQSPHVNMDLDSDVDLKQACAAVATGAKLTQAPEQERAWIAAIGKRCPNDPKGAYIEAMRALKTRYPDDLDALTLYAESLMVPVRWHWYDKAGRPAAGVAEAEHALEEVLRRRPDHPGANHLYIHAVESSPLPERAIPSAERLMGIVPAAGHLVHMPAHIWLVLGDFELAASVNERAAAVDREYFSATGVSHSSYMGYYIHNLHFVAFARSMQGRMTDAIRTADEIGKAVEPVIPVMPDMIDPFAAFSLFMRARFERWDDLLAAPAPNSRLAVSNALWHYARTLALAGKDRRADALREQAEFEAARKKIPATAIWGNNKPADALAVAAEVLAGRLAESPAASVPRWRRAVELQDALVYDEPPAWYYPIRESLGGALLRAGKPAEAEVVFREGLRRGLRNGRLLFGLVESLKAQKKSVAAEWVSREFEAAWSHAEIKLSIDSL
jgi:tetratricopeptide (TPR) repeat protein